MKDKLYTRKYTISVEGETEKWYFDWLEKQINACEGRAFNASTIPTATTARPCARCFTIPLGNPRR